ncbi:hypothetical protein [Dyadobacter bucti]|uniref:hypothetical protein n=1 Tax=Dyadobacter bucti TaxID=2572203 RepID=UPI003F729DF2
MLDKLSKHKLIRFQSVNIECHLIDDDYYKALVSQLMNKGLTGTFPVLYYFQIASEICPRDIQDRVRRMKMSPGKTDRSMPRVNLHTLSETANVLYVGKTNNDFFLG